MLVHSKKGGILKILGIIFLVIIIIVAAAFIYVYNFHVFKKLMICITPEIEETEKTCVNNNDCTELIKQNLNSNEMPAFLKEKIEETIDKAVFCEETCKHRKYYTNFIGEDQREIENCAEGEEEISIEIRGKEGLQILNLLKESQMQ